MRLLLLLPLVIGLLPIIDAQTTVPKPSLALLNDISFKLGNLLSSGGNLAKIIRLNFHDCVGGCNGCVNLNDPSNAGLSGIVQSLDSIYVNNGYRPFITRADYWAYAGILAVNRAIANNNNDCGASACQVPTSGLVFKYGRVDCSTAPVTSALNDFPNAHLNYTALMDYFARNFAMTPDEVVALMGAHNVGVASNQNSGFQGTWVQGEVGELSNKYYQVLSTFTDWTLRDNTPTSAAFHWQWSSSAGIDLNTDIVLYKYLITDNSGRSMCTFNGCPFSPTAQTVRNYASSNSVWMPAFAKVYDKMLSTGRFVLNPVV